MPAPGTPTSNKFCRLADLTNEASVEDFFVSRLLVDLGYTDDQIRPKTSLRRLAINMGRQRMNYKPDYAIQVGGVVRWVIDAKAPQEALDAYTGQCASYCLNLNRAFVDGNPVAFYMLTNGITTQLYPWDSGEVLLALSFGDLVDGNPNYRRLRQLLAPAQVAAGAVGTRTDERDFVLYRKSIDEVNADFAWCHQFIYRKDSLSQSAAFMEFVKIIFLKLLSDKHAHNHVAGRGADGEMMVRPDHVRFRLDWIREREADHPNPLDALQFQTLLRTLEDDIQAGRRKRIFQVRDRIGLSAETIKGVVEKLQHTDLYGIDEDLNGRLFETFLNATMRGKDLGQFFTPRSVVSLAVSRVDPQAGREGAESVIDACCGTGGFLIDALSHMWGQIARNNSLTDRERTDLRSTVAKHRIYGVDIGREPPVAQIARMNMYLHGDGSSSVYQADALDKQFRELDTDGPEVASGKAELKRLIREGHGFDVAVTNPPFAKEYQRRYQRDSDILGDYDLSFDQRGGRRVPRTSVKSSVLFLERYCDLLRPGGRFITVIDDSILGGRAYQQVRDFIRSRFVVRAVISLPGDAFQRSKARVKTSLLYLVKRNQPEERQTPVFMYYCTKVGVDDPARARVLPVDRQNREEALAEIAAVRDLFHSFMTGRPAAEPWTVPPEGILDRMDVKNCLPRPGRLVQGWRADGVAVVSLGDLVVRHSSIAG
ncbi:MAG TPA: N-6 DNA methylase [Armatimonadota bacterium]|jgi:type I restriction enzyme M protein